MKTQSNKPSAAVFVDVQNIYYTCRDSFRRQFNYQALWDALSSQYQIEHAYAYAIDKGDNKQQNFQNALQRIGFTVKLKPFIQRSDGSAKGDWDVGITIDVMEFAPEVEHIILLSGDGDFDMLMKKVHSKYQCQTHAFGVQGLTANSLIQSVNNFYRIDESLLMPRN